jgi:hypothetical protein
MVNGAGKDREQGNRGKTVERFQHIEGSKGPGACDGRSRDNEDCRYGPP